MTDDGTILEFRDVTKRFRVRSGSMRERSGSVVAVHEFDLTVDAGEIVGLVGQSGAGKTTVGRLALGLERPDAGQVYFEGEALARKTKREMRRLRQRTHLIFQDPYQSLHPGMRVWNLVAEPLEIVGVGRRERRDAAFEALELVKLTPASDYVDRFPHELSGGQRQRVAFARAHVANPRLVIADEPTSMLDVSLRAGILELVLDLRDDNRSGVLYITHELAVARHICDRIGVMNAGALIELGPADQIVDQPVEPYTRRLLEAAKNLGRD